MPSSPREGQEFVGFKLDQKLLSMIDKVRGFADRSLWFRQAIAEKLKALGHPVSDDMIFPPSRTSAHRLAVVMDEEAKPVSEARKPVEYKRPKRTRKTS